MRIVGGKLRGRKLLVPEGKETRPTLDRVRETVFNVLEHNPALLNEDGTSRLINATVLDAFAGSGALGIEALSRGARSAVFYEIDKAAFACLRSNTSGLSVKLVSSSVLRPQKATEACDIAFFDPPFRQDFLLPAVSALADNGWINRKTLVYWEADAKERLPGEFSDKVVLERRIGKVMVRFFTV